MTLKKFLNKIKWDTSVVDLKKYLSGDKHIPLRNKKELDIAKDYIKEQIPFRQKNNEQFCYDFLTSDMCHLAEVLLLKRKRKITKNNLINTAFDILNTANSQRQTELLRTNELIREKSIPDVFNDCIYTTEE